MEQVTYHNSYGKVLKNGWVQVDPPCAQTGVKSSLGTFKSVNINYRFISIIAYCNILLELNTSDPDLLIKVTFAPTLVIV